MRLNSWIDPEIYNGITSGITVEDSVSKQIMEEQIVHLLHQLNQKIVIEIDNNANAKNPDTFIFILNHDSQYLYFQSN